MSLGGSVTIFPGPGGCGSIDLGAATLLRWSPAVLALEAGAGVLWTSDRSGVPTYTDREIGPSLHAGAQLRLFAVRRLYGYGGLGVFVYPTQPLVVLAVGLDLRWSLGIGLEMY